MNDAYGLARALDIHLSEHGGTGQGVIGALAGAGLRLGGDDGRLRGKLEFDTVDGRVSVAQLLNHPYIDAVRSVDGHVPSAAESVQLQDKVKTVLLGGQSVLLVEKNDSFENTGLWQNLSRKNLKSY